MTKTPVKQKGPEHVAWGTKQEISWLNTIGSHCQNQNGTSRLDFLYGYRASMEKRSVWEKIDLEAVSAYLSALIKEAVLEPGAKIG